MALEHSLVIGGMQQWQKSIASGEAAMAPRHGPGLGRIDG